jgi:hypothetical protein
MQFMMMFGDPYLCFFIQPPQPEQSCGSGSGDSADPCEENCLVLFFS